MSIRLIILGLLMECNRHPYDIRQTIKIRNWHMTFRIKDGSLYYAFEQLKADGLIEVAETIPVQGEHRPDKIVYRITDDGKEALQELIYKQIEQDFFPQHPIFAALPFVRHADAELAVPKLEKRLQACLERIERLELVLSVKGDRLPYGSVRMIEGVRRFSETERDWLTDLLADAREKRLSGRGNIPEEYR